VPDAVAAARRELARQDPALRIRRRLLEFAPFAPPELPRGVELPEEFVAACFRFSDAFPESSDSVDAALAALGAVAERMPVVVLDAPQALQRELSELDARRVDGLERGGLTAVLARARGFVGSYGTEAYLAVLLGVPAVALQAPLDAAAENDLRLASSFLGRPPFGTLNAIPLGAANVAESTSALLDAAAARASIGLRG
jgi:hypothetical protein